MAKKTFIAIIETEYSASGKRSPIVRFKAWDEKGGHPINDLMGSFGKPPRFTADGLVIRSFEYDGQQISGKVGYRDPCCATFELREVEAMGRTLRAINKERERLIQGNARPGLFSVTPDELDAFREYYAVSCALDIQHIAIPASGGYSSYADTTWTLHPNDPMAWVRRLRLHSQDVAA